MLDNFETIQCSKTRGILTIFFNRSKSLNSFTHQMMIELIKAVDYAENDDSVRAIIFTGKGRAFCAGADLSKKGETFDFSKRKDKVNGIAPDEGGLLTLRLFDCKKPLIAAVNGPAVGIGATLQLPMDIRIGSSLARFGFVFSNRGLVPEACSSWFLPRIVGISKALEWCFSGDVFDANQALQAGLIKEITTPEKLMPRAVEIATELTKKSSPVSIALTRQMMWKMLGADHPIEAHKIDSRGIQIRGSSRDGIEGIKSFLEKRPANFIDSVNKDMPDYYPWWKPRNFD
ncbi:MAG: enoyl-CoA hydratase [Proteobacteria bacterium]|nr:enoyl-CoA hydratase [Pseudomonadota bacterium]